MNAAEKVASLTFRPTLQARKRLEYAEKLGFSKTQVINDVLEAHLRKHVENLRQKNAKSLMEALQSDVP